MKWFVLLLFLTACAPALNERASPFPIPSELRNFPTWRATVPAFERVLLDIVKGFDPSLKDARAQDRAGQRGMREVVSSGLETQKTALMFVEEEETVVLGVLDLENPKQGAFAVSLERAIAEAADKLFPRVVYGQVNKSSKFAGFFPYDPTGRDLPVWAVSLESALPVVVEATKRFDVAYASTYGFELTDLQTNRLRLFELRSAALERDGIEVYLSGEGDRVALGVFEVNSGGRLRSGSKADRLEDAVVAAMDGLFKRSPD